MAIKMTDTQHYSDIADAIRAKSGSQDTYTPAQMASAINAIPTGGGAGVEEKDVNFYDYDGTLLYSYTASEFMALEDLPENPSHEGLTAQGWNWELTYAKEFVRDGGALDVGQIYTTSDGKTRIYIDMTGPRLSPYLVLGINGTVEIDWGDGTAVSTQTGNNLNSEYSVPHTYTPGSYVITLTVTGTAKIFGSGYSYLLKGIDNYDYVSTIKKVHVGDNIVFGDYAFAECSRLETLTIPAGSVISKYFCQNCYGLKHFNMPDYNNPATPGYGTYAFNNCTSMDLCILPRHIAIGSCDYFYSGCSALRRSTTPLGIFAKYYYNGCYKLAAVIAPYATTLNQNAFFNCASLHRVKFGDRTAFGGANVFSGCTSLQTVDLPGTGPTQQYSFRNCCNLTHITLPATCTSIAANTFNSCWSLKELHLLRTEAITTLANINALSGIPSDCVIYVPASLLTTYQSATNWDMYNTRFLAEP